MTFRALLARPTAYAPMAMSLAALALVLTYLARYGPVPENPQGDEGAAAHTFQLLLAAQLPVIAVFAATWLPRAPAGALKVLALQALAGLAALAPVLYFEM